MVMPQKTVNSVNSANVKNRRDDLQVECDIIIMFRYGFKLISSCNELTFLVSSLLLFCHIEINNHPKD